jgi:hypothetical protein
LIGCPTVFFFAGRLTGIFIFGLPILDRIESPAAVVNLRLYFDNGIDLYRPSSSTARHGRMRRTRGAPTCIASACSHLCGLLCRSVFVVIVRDFTDNDAITSDLRVFIQAMAHTALPSV